ncbi:MAG: DNA-protecting protein DprA [Methylococcales bacterium]|nr:DNA-protecting protein DprA [Methylococcales bacterium]MBT7410083.1 DNA-protecting protein DprA [Methylococcales bacterium]
MEDINYWLTLHHTTGIGPKLFQRILQQFPELKTFFDSSDLDKKQLGLSDKVINNIKRFNWDDLEKDLKWSQQDQCHILTLNQPHYPELLKNIYDPPPILYVHGNLDNLMLPQIAVVGSRNPTPHGQKNAYQFSYELAQTGFTITSGLALGIDGSAHQATIDAKGKTIAVMGTGVDRIYPARHKKLAHQIVDNEGTLISEFPLGTTPTPHNFPKRNRIISGLSLGTLVVEATRKSGSLITAKSALEQSREVFAIPGSIHNPLSRGCHQIIKEGATLVEESNDIVAEIKIFTNLSANDQSPTSIQDLSNLSDDQQALLQVISFDPISIDEIMLSYDASIEDLTSQLVDLELQGYVVALPGGRYQRFNS